MKKKSKFKSKAKFQSYKDPLHVPYSELVVKHKGKEVYMMNKRLLDQQNCWENLEKIKAAHVKKLDIYDLISATDSPINLKYYAKLLMEIEFELQGLWKFSLDYNFHRIWEYPKCACPKMDNLDRYPHGHIIVANCPLHGFEIFKISLVDRIKSRFKKFWKETKEEMGNIGSWTDDL